MTDEGTMSGSNTGARDHIINDAFAKLFGLEQEIEAAKQKHVKPMTKERTKLWRALKKDTDIEREDMEPDYKRFKRARLAMEMEDEVARERVLDNLRAVHEALHPGGQVDWIAAMNWGSAPTQAAPKDETEGSEADDQPSDGDDAVTEGLTEPIKTEMPDDIGEVPDRGETVVGMSDNETNTFFGDDEEGEPAEDSAPAAAA